MIDSISLFDILISTLYTIVILVIASFFRPSKDKVYYKYYNWFVYSKIFFGVSFAFIYVYYFKGGDTFLYFKGGNYFVEQIFRNPTNIGNLLFEDFGKLRNLGYTKDEYILGYFKATDILLMARSLSLFCFLGAKQYLASTILFTMFTAIGIWKLYVTLCKLYPTLYKHFAIGILFYPTIGIWGSGILKDPATLMCVGLIFASFYNFSKGRKVITSLVITIAASFICLKLKPYILYVFLPSMLLWLQNRFSSNIKNTFLKSVLLVFLSTVFITSGYFMLQTISESAGKYSLDNAQNVAKGFHSWHTYLAETRNQSGYSLGEVEFTITGIAEKSPEAFFVTYYRPFLFTDVDNFSLAFEAVQSLILLILTFYIILKVGIIKFFKIIFTQRDVSAFLIFSVIFGIVVGITSYNFGALSRYKIPGLPFYVAALTIIYYLGTKSKALNKFN